MGRETTCLFGWMSHPKDPVRARCFNPREHPQANGGRSPPTIGMSGLPLLLRRPDDVVFFALRIVDAAIVFIVVAVRVERELIAVAAVGELLIG